MKTKTGLRIFNKNGCILVYTYQEWRNLTLIKKIKLWI